MVLNWQTGWLLGWLAVWSAADIRKREISCAQLFFVLGIGVIWQGVLGQLIGWDTAGGLIVGGLAWGFGCLSSGRFGKGDGLVILCLGLYLGAGITLSVLLLSLLLSSVAAGYLLIFKKKPRQFAIPFVPFLMAGFLTGLVFL